MAQQNSMNDTILVVSEDSSVPFQNEIFKKCYSRCFVESQIFRKSHVMTDNKNLVCRKFYFSGALATIPTRQEVQCLPNAFQLVFCLFYLLLATL